MMMEDDDCGPILLLSSSAFIKHSAIKRFAVQVNESILA
jgi:hypothetical protein